MARADPAETALTMHQFRALTFLRAGRRRTTDIARTLGIRLSSATSLIDRMEAKGLVHRFHGPEDRRVVWCELTPVGQTTADNFWQVRHEGLENVAWRLRDEELDPTMHALGMLLAALEEPQEPSPGKTRIAA